MLLNPCWFLLEVRPEIFRFHTFSCVDPKRQKSETCSLCGSCWYTLFDWPHVLFSYKDISARLSIRWLIVRMMSLHSLVQPLFNWLISLVFVRLSVMSDYSDCVEAGGWEGGGEGTWLPDSSAAQESNAHLQRRPQHLQDTGYTHSDSLGQRIQTPVI